MVGWLSDQLNGDRPVVLPWGVQVSDLIVRAQAHASRVTDAPVAALAIEHGAVLCTSDRGFARFPGLRTLDPTAMR